MRDRPVAFLHPYFPQGSMSADVHLKTFVRNLIEFDMSRAPQKVQSTQNT